MRYGLVMEGGAMRGLFTAGVLDVLLEQGVTFDGAVGVSAGAVFGCNFKSNQPGRVLRYNLRFCRDPRYCSLRSWAKTGDLYGADFCYRAIPDELDLFDRAAYASNPMDFTVVCTDAETGRPVYHSCPTGDEHDLVWMRASASMPLVSRVVKIDGYELLDGGIADATPYLYMESLGYDRNVVILTQPADYRKEKSALLPLVRLALRRYPRLAEAMAHRAENYNRHIAYIAQKEKEGQALVIRPPEPLGIHRTEKNPAELERVYQIGRQEALRQLDEIRRFLQK